MKTLDLELETAMTNGSSGMDWKLVLLLLLFITRGIAMICVLPPGEMWDELSHLAYVDYWSTTGRPAIYGQTNVDHAFLAAMAHFPQPAPSGFGRPYQSYWAGAQPPALPSSVILYEAQHPFLYYAVAAPIYAISGGRSNLPAAVSVLRLVNLACGTAALGLILSWLYRNVKVGHATIVGSWIVLQPLLLLNVVRVANDALAFFLGSIVIVNAMDLHRNGYKARIAMLSLFLPLSILAKTTNATLIPAVIFAIFTASKRHHCHRKAIGSGIIIVTGSSLLLAPYIAFNLHIFGLITPMQEAVANRAAGRSLGTVLTSVPIVRWPVWSASWWVINALWVGGWSFLWPPRVLELAYASLIAAAGSATVMRWRSLQMPTDARWITLTLALCVQTGLMFHAAESYCASHGQMFTNSWYAAVAIPWLLILLGSGSFSIQKPGLRMCILLGVPILFTCTELYGVFVLMLPKYYSALPLSSISMARMARLHSVMFSPTTWICSCVIVLILMLALGQQIHKCMSGVD